MEGIESLKKLLSLGLELGNAVGVSLEDGKLSFDDLSNFMGVLGKVGPAVEGFANVQKEIKDLTVEEIRELNRYVTDNFDIPQDELEGRIEQGMTLAVALYEYVKPFLKKKEA